MPRRRGPAQGHPSGPPPDPHPTGPRNREALVFWGPLNGLCNTLARGPAAA